MESFEERLSKRKEEIAKAEQEKKEQTEKTQQEKEAEMQRLTNLMEKFRLRERLVLVKDKIWGKGDIKKNVITYKSPSIHVDSALKLSTLFWDVMEFPIYYGTGADLFGRKGLGISSVTTVGQRELYIKVGAKTEVDVYRKKLPIDIIYVSYSGFSYSGLSDDGYYEPRTEDLTKQMPISSGDSNISKFIEDSLIEFTDYRFTPANLDPIGKKRIIMAPNYLLDKEGIMQRDHFRSQESK